MDKLIYIGYLLLMVVAIYQIRVSIIIWRAEEFEKIQRVFQLLIIWIIPIFGGLGCHLFLRSQRGTIQAKRNGFVHQESNVEIGFGDIKP
ncbi:hypothetical protein ACO0KZ_16060 [Undibacterium sp. Di24W]